MKVSPVHAEYRLSHLEKVKDEMRVLGPPKIRAIWCEDRGVWAALEGCHRLHAALELGLEPEIIPVDYEPGMTWADVGMAHDYVAGAISLDKVVEGAGTFYVIGFGEDKLPMSHEVRRPKPGEIMKYRIVMPINFDFDGNVVGGVGTEFTSEEATYDVSDYVSMGYIEIVADPEKVTKERRESTVRKVRGRQKKED